MNINKTKKILKSLKKVHWDTAVRTYGNNHSTLIGLLVDWWLSLSAKNRVLEGGPTNGYHQKGARGQCDALLCEGDNPIGVLEVEGTRHETTIKKVGKFFNAKRQEFRTVSFGIILFYAYEPVGTGRMRTFFKPFNSNAKKIVLSVSKEHPEKSIVVISLEKKYQQRHEGVRSWNPYYKGEAEKIYGSVFINGKEIFKLSFYEQINS
jgi:hypothetical protein